MGRGASRGDKNRPYERSAMWRVFNRLFVRAGLLDDDGKPIATPHGLRATGATLAAEAGVPLHVIQNQLGQQPKNDRTPDERQGDRVSIPWSTAKRLSYVHTSRRGPPNLKPYYNHQGTGSGETSSH